MFHYNWDWGPACLATGGVSLELTDQYVEYCPNMCPRPPRQPWADTVPVQDTERRLRRCMDWGKHLAIKSNGHFHLRRRRRKSECVHQTEPRRWRPLYEHLNIYIKY